MKAKLALGNERTKQKETQITQRKCSLLKFQRHRDMLEVSASSLEQNTPGPVGTSGRYRDRLVSMPSGGSRPGVCRGALSKSEQEITPLGLFSCEEVQSLLCCLVN